MILLRYEIDIFISERFMVRLASVGISADYTSAFSAPAEQCPYNNPFLAPNYFRPFMERGFSVCA